MAKWKWAAFLGLICIIAIAISVSASDGESLLIKGIRQLENRIETLEKRVTDLESRVENLEAENTNGEEDEMAWLSGWDYRKSHEIDGSSVGAQSNYQVRVKVHYTTPKYLTGWSKDGDNPLVDPGDNHVWPCLIFSDSTWHLYMGYWDTGTDATYWTSANGKDFTEHATKSPIITRAQVQTAWSLGALPLALEPHSIIWWDSEWRLYFGVKYADEAWRIGYATSSNLEDWALTDGPCLEPSVGEINTSDPHAVVYNSKVYLYYCCHLAGGDRWCMAAAWSDDGDSFTKFGAGTGYLQDYASAVEFIALEDGITGLYINLSPADNPLNAVWTTDGETLQYYSGNPVFERNAGIAWEAVSLGHATIYKVGSTYWLYYAGKDALDVWKLGRASTTTVTPASDSGEDVYLGGKCRSDFGDIRFTKSDGVSELDYWLQEKVDGDYAIFWVEVDSIPEDPDSATIYVYYGKAAAATTSNGPDTFDFFDDFEGDLSKWTKDESGGTVAIQGVTVKEGSGAVELHDTDAVNRVDLMKYGLPSRDYRVAFYRRADDINKGGYFIYKDATDDLSVFTGIGDLGGELGHLEYYTTEWVDIMAISADTWYLIEYVFRLGAGTFDLWVDGVSKVTAGSMRSQAYDDTGLWLLTAGATADYKNFYDVVRIGKYCDPEPSHSTWGSEEEAPTTGAATAHMAAKMIAGRMI